MTVSAGKNYNPQNDQYDSIDKEWTEWYSNGEKRVEVIYESGGDSKVGKGSGTWNLWFENGNEKLLQSYVNGKADGKWQEWYENGTTKKEYNWKDGNLDGKYVEWYETGQEKIEGEYSCLLYTSPSPRDGLLSRMPSSA